MRVVYGGKEIDFTPPWKRITILDSLKEAGIDAGAMDEDALLAEYKNREIEPPRPFTWGHAVAGLFEALIEHTIEQPTFVCDHPVAISPLTKKKRGDDRLVERFEPIVMGMEIGNAYSELTDPVEQQERFISQKSMGADKDGVENHPMDTDFPMSTIPLSGVSNPNKIFNKVVFPAPFGPTNPTRIPSFKRKDKFLNNILLGNSFQIESILNIYSIN